MDEIKLFEELQPPPPPDASRMREAARARLTAATRAPLTHPARRRRSTVAVAAAALAAAGAGYGSYGLAAARNGSAPLPSTAAARSGSNLPPTATAGLTAVHGCPGMYITAGTLEQVSGTRLIIQPANDQDHANRTWQAQPVTVATSPSTAVTRPVNGTVSDITDGSHVIVQGTLAGQTLAADQVDIEAALPSPQSFGPSIPPGAPKLGRLSAGAMPPFVNGTVADVRDGTFTVVTQAPAGLRVKVTTSSSTKVVRKASASLSQLDLGANVVAVGQIGPHGILTASTVTEPSGPMIILAGGPAKIRPSGCSASAIEAAALAGA